MSGSHAFDCKQETFHGQATAEAANRAVAGDDAMARDDDGDWICAAGRSDGTRGPGFANLLCDPTVGAGFTARDRFQGAPDRLLESCASREVEGNAPADGFAGSVLLDLVGEFANEQRWWTICSHDGTWPSKTGEIYAGDAARGIIDTKRAKLRADDYRITNQMIHSATKDSPSHMKKRLRSRRWTRLRGL